MMKRRTFVSTAAGALLLTAFPAESQPTAKVHRIGVLSLTSFNNTTLAMVLTAPLTARGYVVDKNIVFEERTAEGKAEQLSSLAAELVRLKVDVIVAGPAVAIRAAHDATKTIPIVMAFSGDDPVKSGFVASLARPGGNVTGVTAQVRDLAPKWMELLRDAAPGITRIAVLTNPLRPEHAEYVRMMQAERPGGIRLQTVTARASDQYGIKIPQSLLLRADEVIQ